MYFSLFLVSRLPKAGNSQISPSSCSPRSDIKLAPDSSGERKQRLPGLIHTGESAQSCRQSLRALFGLCAAPEAKGDRG